MMSGCIAEASERWSGGVGILWRPWIGAASKMVCVEKGRLATMKFSFKGIGLVNLCVGYFFATGRLCPRNKELLKKAVQVVSEGTEHVLMGADFNMTPQQVYPAVNQGRMQIYAPQGDTCHAGTGRTYDYFVASKGLAVYLREITIQQAGLATHNPVSICVKTNGPEEKGQGDQIGTED